MHVALCFAVFLHSLLVLCKGAEKMKIYVKLTGLLAASAGFREKTFEFPEGTTISEVFILINLPVGGAWTKSSVNGKLKDKNFVLNDGDELLFFPVGGGG